MGATTRTHYFSVDSRNRDTTAFPSSSSYQTELPEPLRNIISVELVYASFEKLGTENYVNLHVEELVPNLLANANGLNGVFAQLPCIASGTNEYTQDMFRSIKTFEPMCSQLARMRIRFLDHAGVVASTMSDHFLRFEITCRG